ncbi:MAG: hypothetical protein IJ652_00710 [Bacteroidales bacterium]|nr:hypothetical protein [Bacteroidales bacterium]
MKKTAIFLTAAAVFLSVNLHAQDVTVAEEAFDPTAFVPQEDKMIFNHLALGVSPTDFSTLLVPVVATTLTPYVQIRGGLDWFPPLKASWVLGRFGKADLLNIKDIPFGGNNYTFNLDGTLNASDIKLLFDIFPTKRTSFHFTAGFLVSLSGGKVIKAFTTEPFDKDPSDWESLGVNIHNAQYCIMTDKTGNMQMSLKTNAVKPYLGIGFGRAIRPDSRVRVTFDMGVYYSGGFRVAFDNVHPRTAGGSWDMTQKLTYSLTSDDLTGSEWSDTLTQEQLDSWGLSQFGVKGPIKALDYMKRVTSWCPYLKLNIFIKIF